MSLFIVRNKYLLIILLMGLLSILPYTSVLSNTEESYTVTIYVRKQISGPGKPPTYIINPSVLVYMDALLRGATDWEGKFVLSGVSQGSHNFVLKKEGYKELSFSLHIDSNKETTVWLEQILYYMVELSVYNPLNVQRTDEPVIIPWTKLAEAGLPENANPDSLRVTNTTGSEVPSQFDDLTAYGYEKYLVFPATVPGNSNATYHLHYTTESWTPPNYTVAVPITETDTEYAFTANTYSGIVNKNNGVMENIKTTHSEKLLDNFGYSRFGAPYWTFGWSQLGINDSRTTLVTQGPVRSIIVAKGEAWTDEPGVGSSNWTFTTIYLIYKNRAEAMTHQVYRGESMQLMQARVDMSHSVTWVLEGKGTLDTPPEPLQKTIPTNYTGYTNQPWSEWAGCVFTIYPKTNWPDYGKWVDVTSANGSFGYGAIFYDSANIVRVELSDGRDWGANDLELVFIQYFAYPSGPIPPGCELWYHWTLLPHEDTDYTYTQAECEKAYNPLTIETKHITSDTTWTLEESPYIVAEDVVVDPGVTLTIEPGVEVRFAGNYSLIVEGVLVAEGNESSRIIFTSNRTEPRPGDWCSIEFRSESSGSIMYCDIEYAMVGIFLNRTSGITVLRSNISKNFYEGVYLLNSTGSKIICNDVAGNGVHGIHLKNSCCNEITNNNVFDNKEFGITLDFCSSYNNVSGNLISNREEGIRVYEWNVTWYEVVREDGAFGDALGSSTFPARFHHDPEGFDVYYDHIGFKATMDIEVSKDLTVTFEIESDDGSRLFVDGVGVIDLWWLHPYEIKSVDLSLRKGRHSLEMWWYEWEGDSIASFDLWTGHPKGIALLENSNNNTIHGNVVCSGEDSTRVEQGILLQHSLNNLISSNNITSSSHEGIFMNNSTAIITGNKVEQSGASGIELCWGSYAIVIENSVGFTEHAGIWIQASTGHIAENLIYNCSWGGIELHRAMAEGCIIVRNDVRFTVFSGIFLDSSTNISVLNNTIHYTSNWGVDLYRSNNTNILGNDIAYTHGIIIGASSNNTVSGNTVLYDGWTNIHTWESMNISITHNHIEGGDHGIGILRSNQTYIAENKIRSCKYNAIWVGESNSITIVRNKAEDNGAHGIIFDKVLDANVTDNMVHNNSVGLFLLKSNITVVSGNEILNNREHGILAISSKDGLIRDNTVSHNGFNGASLESVNHTVVVGNLVKGNGWNGVGLYGFSSGNMVVANTIVENRLSGIDNWGLDNEAHWNAIEGNLEYGVHSKAMFDATLNWWGHPSGPHHPTLNPSGQGDEVSDNVIFKPWLRV